MAYYNQAFLLNRKGETAQAIAMFEKAIEINPQSYSSHFNRGVNYERLGEYEQAIADYSRCIEMMTPATKLSPQEKNGKDLLAAAYLNRALARVRLKQTDAALKDFALAAFKRLVLKFKIGSFFSQR